MNPAPAAEDLLRLPVHVHGPGRAACSLAAHLVRAGARVAGLSGGSEAGAQAARDALGAGIPCTRALPALPGDVLLLLGVPDDALAGVAAELARGHLPPGGVALHLSGRQGRPVLAPLAARGLRTAAFHPLRSFPARRPGAGDLGGCLVAVDGDAELLPALLDLGRRLGGDPVPLAEAGRPLYHLGASMLGNGVLGVAGVAVQALRAAGIPEAAAIRGLVNIGTDVLARAGREGLPEALTGPVARGDTATLDAHLAALEALAPAWRGLYLGLVRAQLELCAEREDGARAAPARHWLVEREMEDHR